jgi:Putative sensor
VIARAARDLAHLLAGVLIGPATFMWVLFTTLASGLLSVTYLGSPVFLAVTWVTRRIAHLERLRAGALLGRPIPDPYEPWAGANPWARGRDLLRRPTTWRDLAWLTLLFPLGLACGIPGVVVAVVDLATIAAPTWLWAVPNPHLPPLVDARFHTVPGRLALSVLGILLAVPAWWLVRVLARVQAGVAERLLGPGPRQCLGPPSSPSPAAGSWTRRPPSCSASSATCTTALRPASSRPG